MRHRQTGITGLGSTHQEAMADLVERMNRAGKWNFTWDELEAFPDPKRNRYWSSVIFGFLTSDQRFIDQNTANAWTGRHLHGEDIREAQRRSTKALILQAAPPKEDIERLLKRAGCVWDWPNTDELEFSVSKQNSDWVRSQISVLLADLNHKWQKVQNTRSAETWHYWLYVDSLP